MEADESHDTVRINVNTDWSAIRIIPMARQRKPRCHYEERQRRSNPQKRDEQDCRVAIPPRNDSWGNDNKGFVCFARHNGTPA
jgi:hypothetical protein